MNTNPMTEQSTKPEIWNPNAAANWSLVFSPAFGAFLHARNAEKLGRHEEVASNKKWFYGYLIYLGVVLFSEFIPSFPYGPIQLIGMVILLTWYFKLGKKQIKYVKDTYGTDYKRKSWGKPLLIALGCLVVFLVIVGIFGWIEELLHGTATP